MPRKQEKRIRLGGAELAIALDPSFVEVLRRTIPYKHVVSPALHWLRRARKRTNSHGESAELSSLPPKPIIADTPEAASVLERVSSVSWYHSIDLPHGVSTPGYVDHRTQVPLYGLPEDMRGLRALDVATYDGFWAFEMERRGAEVTAIDLESLAQCDYPRRFRQDALRESAQRALGHGFNLARELLSSRVERKVLSVYDLSPDEVGTFDVVFLSDLLLHLRDPALAIENVCSVTKEDGFAIIAEPYNEQLDDFMEFPVSRFGYGEAVGWWHLSSSTLQAMMWVAGFEVIEEISRFHLISHAPTPLHKVVLKGFPSRRQTTSH